MIARVLHNTFIAVDEFHIEDGYQTIRAEVGELRADEVVLDRIFRIHNAIDGTERVVKLGLRSLSVGDAVELDGRRYLCAGMGWERING